MSTRRRRTSSFAAVLDSNKGFERLLGQLVEHRGVDSQIYLTGKETEDFDIESANHLFLQFKLAYLDDVPHCSRRWGAVVPQIVIAVILIVCGVLCITLTSQYEELRQSYSKGDTKLTFDLNNTRLVDAKELVVYFQIRDYYPAYSPTYKSRPRELFGGYTCDAKSLRLKDLLAIRPSETLPEIKDISDPSRLIFPCGLCAFSIFNDKGVIATDETWETASGRLVGSDSLVVFAKAQRPDHLTPHDDWFFVLEPRFRAWMFPGAGKVQRFASARLKRIDKTRAEILADDILPSLPDTKIVVNLEQNVWPSKAWKSPKEVVIAGNFGSLGSTQSTFGYILIGFGETSLSFSQMCVLCRSVVYSVGSDPESVGETESQNADRVKKSPDRSVFGRVEELDHSNKTAHIFMHKASTRLQDEMTQEGDSPPPII